MWMEICLENYLMDCMAKYSMCVEMKQEFGWVFMLRFLILKHE